MEQAHETHPDDARPSRNMARGGQTSEDGLASRVINDLSTSTWAFSVLAAALETGLLEALSESKARSLTESIDSLVTTSSTGHALD